MAREETKELHPGTSVAMPSNQRLHSIKGPHQGAGICMRVTHFPGHFPSNESMSE